MGRRTPSFEARRWLGDLAITQKVKTNEISRRTPTIRRFFGISTWNPNVGSCGRCFKEPIVGPPPTIGLWNRTDRTYGTGPMLGDPDFMVAIPPVFFVRNAAPDRRVAEGRGGAPRRFRRCADGRVERGGSPGWTPRHRSVGVDLKNLLDFDL